MRLGDLLVAFDDDLSGLLVDDVFRSDTLHRIDANQVVLADLNPLDSCRANLPGSRLGEFLVLADDDLAFGILDLARAALANQIFGLRLLQDLAPIELDGLDRVEILE